MHSLNVLRHSAVELLACVVEELFPGVILVGGEATEFGFYYDFIAEQPINTLAIALLEEKLRGWIKQDAEVRSLDMMRENAASFFEHREQPLIAQKILEAPENIVSVIQIGTFHDFCPYPHVMQTREIGAIKLLKIEPASHFLEEEGMLDVVRIHGTVFPEPQSLKKFLKTVESSKKRDHRVIIKELDLAAQHDEMSHLEWCWHPKGSALIQVLKDLWQDAYAKQHFKFVSTPSLVKISLIRKAGNKESFLESTVDDVDYAIPSTTAPMHAILFGSKLHSYRELPVRYAEMAKLSSLNKGGQLWGMLHSRLVHSDTAHIFCSPEQLESELISSLQFIEQFIKIFGFEYRWHLRGRDNKFAGTLGQWKKCQECFEAAFAQCGMVYESSQELSSIGPVAEATLVDAIGREWKGPSISIDFTLPERFSLRYQGADDREHMPVMVVRSLLGSIERFVAILAEHFAGRFPVWLAPEQVRVIPVLKHNHTYAEGVGKALEAAGYRVSVDYRPEQLGVKIHGAESENVPYMIIVGDKEEEKQQVTVRSGMPEAMQKGVLLQTFLQKLNEEVSSKSLANTIREKGSPLESQ